MFLLFTIACVVQESDWMIFRAKLGLLHATTFFVFLVTYYACLYEAFRSYGQKWREKPAAGKCREGVYEERRQLLEEVCAKHSEELEDHVRQVSKHFFRI